jgi:thiol:disulfide interchange protein
MKKIILPLLFIFTTIAALAQTPAIQYSFEKDTLGAGEFNLRIKARIAPGVKLFSIKKISAELPVNTVFEFDTASVKYLADSVKEKGNAKTEKFAELENQQVTFYTDSVEWTQKIKLNKGDSIRIKGVVTGYYPKDGSVESATGEISRQFAYINDYKAAAITNGGGGASKNKGSKSLLALLLAGIGAGLIGFLTPCVYALVPVTVSMFLKRSKTPVQGRKNALWYAFSILIIYTIVGAMVSTFLPEKYLNQLSTNWIFNLFVFAMFIVFGLSFLGAFEIQLPSSWATSLDKKAGAGSFGGIFFMALVLVVVSFSCTGNFVAGLLGTGGAAGKFGPVTGMFGFGLGLALPFALFAVFPALMKNLNKSGGWQNALKVSLGFIELALAMKFLSNADVSKNWNLLDREIYLAIWIAIFGLLGLYLLGKFRMKNDSELPKNDWDIPYLPIPRLLFALTSFGFVIYLLPGMWGAPLNGVSGLLPPINTQDYLLFSSSGSTAPAATTASYAAGTASPPAKHVKELKKFEPYAALKNNITIYYDYDEAFAAAKALKKPLMLDFTGINCPNCREFESKIWVNDGVSSRMNNDFVIASLFEDFEEELPDNEQRYSDILAAPLKTVGDKYKELSKKLTGGISQPNYIFLDNNGSKLAEEGYGYDALKGPGDFIGHLDKVKKTFKERNP